MGLTGQEIEEFLRVGGLFDTGDGWVFIGWGPCTWGKKPRPGSANFYSPDFYLQESQPWLRFKNFARVKKKILYEMIENFSCGEIKRKWKEPSVKVFRDDFSVIKKQISLHRLTKAVPIVVHDGTYSASHRDFHLYLLKHLLNIPKWEQLRAYGFWDSNQGLLGATPEILFIKKNKKDILTMALGGTRPRKSSSDRTGEGMLKDEKLSQEHVAIVEGILASLHPYGRVTISPSRVMFLSMLKHIETDISLHLNRPTSFENLVKALHPTPALGAFPKDEGLQLLRSLKNQKRRKRFGAPFGILLPDGTCHCLVAIRNIQWKKRQFEVFAGCGIIQNSRLQEEWKELKAKTASVRKIFAL